MAIYFPGSTGSMLHQIEKSGFQQIDEKTLTKLGRKCTSFKNRWKMDRDVGSQKKYQEIGQQRLDEYAKKYIEKHLGVKRPRFFTFLQSKSLSSQHDTNVKKFLKNAKNPVACAKELLRLLQNNYFANPKLDKNGLLTKLQSNEEK